VAGALNATPRSRLSTRARAEALLHRAFRRARLGRLPDDGDHRLGGAPCGDQRIALLAGPPRASGPNVRGISCDVADPVGVERATEASYDTFGNVHVVCDNAGVAGGSGIDNISLDNCRWVLDVNLMGVVRGIRTFLPRIRGHDEGGHHIVNTASLAAMPRVSTGAISITRANRSAQVSTAHPRAGSFDVTHDALRCVGLRHAFKPTARLPMT
jgi:NAD(P)-dependent dehydrogenase (short-subunit alcohol dehydrogenase family)